MKENWQSKKKKEKKEKKRKEKNKRQTRKCSKTRMDTHTLTVKKEYFYRNKTF